MNSTAAVLHPSETIEGRRRVVRLGTFVFLASEAMLFAGLISGYIVLRIGLPEWPPAGAPSIKFSFPPSPLNWIMLLNTAILISSSFTYHRAEVLMSRGKTGLGWIFVTALFGTTFLSIQAWEWMHLKHEGMWLGSHGVYSSDFFILTGFHGAHVLIGVLMILIALFRAFGRTVFKKDNLSHSHNYEEVVGLYWHFVDIVWIFLFTILYIL